MERRYETRFWDVNTVIKKQWKMTSWRELGCQEFSFVCFVSSGAAYGGVQLTNATALLTFVTVAFRATWLSLESEIKEVNSELIREGRPKPPEN